MKVRMICALLLLATGLFAQQSSTGQARSKQATPTNSTAKPADQEAAKVADIRRLLELTGTRDMVNQMKSSMMAQFRQNAPAVPQDMLDEMMSELKAEDLEESFIPLYSRHFSGEDIKHLIAFYQR